MWLYIVNQTALLIELKVGTPIGNSIATRCHRRGGSRAPGRWWDCLGLYRISEGIPQYTNAPMTVFVPEGTVMATCTRFVKILGILLIILAKLCWLISWAALIRQQDLVSFSHTKTPPKIKKAPNIHKNTKILWFHQFNFFIKSNPLTAIGWLICQAHSADDAS